MAPLFTKAPCTGKVATLLRGRDRQAGLEKMQVETLTFTQEGIVGDSHAGLTRASDSRTLQLYPRGLAIRNVRQVTLVSEEELAEIAQRMGVPDVKPEWLGANIVTSAIPHLTFLPPSTRLQFLSGATLVVDLENNPCRQVADVIARHHPECEVGFVTAAQHKRGVTAWVEREGRIAVDDAIMLWLPPQRIYSPEA